MFHTTISKSLFICKRERHDIQPTVPFLCNISKEPYEYDWKKLLRMIRYLQEKQGEKLTLNINDITMVEWYADAAFVLHTDMKSHTGGVLTMGEG